MKTSQYLFSLDPLDDGDTEELDGGLGQQKVHIRIQQRNGRKTITTVQGNRLKLIATKF